MKRGAAFGIRAIPSVVLAAADGRMARVLRQPCAAASAASAAAARRAAGRELTRSM
jgi:hypothetical protein